MLWYCCVLTRDWSFVARFLASRKPYFYTPIHAELSKLIISKQFLILPIHPAWCFDKLQIVIANLPIPTCVIISSKSANHVLLQFQRILHPHHVLQHSMNSWSVIANFPFVSIMTCDWKILAVIANNIRVSQSCDRVFLFRLLLIRGLSRSFCLQTSTPVIAN